MDINDCDIENLCLNGATCHDQVCSKLIMNIYKYFSFRLMGFGVNVQLVSMEPSAILTLMSAIQTLVKMKEPVRSGRTLTNVSAKKGLRAKTVRST